jgi:S-adenosylmethionine hydrolase
VAPALVTLTTDLGTADGYVGAMKGVLHRTAPGLVIVDITHDVPRHDIAAGAHALATAAPWFPAGTVHVGVVDPGVGGGRRGVVVVAREQIFVGPDNGLFSLVAPQPAAAYEIAAPEFRADRVSPTFHGRDLFAVAAARLAAGASPDEVGPRALLVGRLADGVAGSSEAHRVVHVDTFGNLITDIAAEVVPAGGRVRVGGRDVGPVRRTFEDVARGELLAYVGSGGTVAIAVREGSAAERLGAGRADPVEVVPP